MVEWMTSLHFVLKAAVYCVLEVARIYCKGKTETLNYFLDYKISCQYIRVDLILILVFYVWLIQKHNVDIN